MPTLNNKKNNIANNNNKRACIPFQFNWIFCDFFRGKRNIFHEKLQFYLILMPTRLNATNERNAHEHNAISRKRVSRLRSTIIIIIISQNDCELDYARWQCCCCCWRCPNSDLLDCNGCLHNLSARQKINATDQTQTPYTERTKRWWWWRLLWCWRCWCWSCWWRGVKCWRTAVRLCATRLRAVNLMTLNAGLQWSKH